MAETLTYARTIEGLAPDALTAGFFDGWAAPPSAEQHLDLLRGSAHVAVALDGGRVIGFANAISDGVLCAYIPLLEVLPGYRRRRIGSKLIELLLDAIGPLYMIDVMCDEEVLPFYESLGFRSANGAVRRNYGWRADR